MKEKIACILKECRKKNKFSVDYVANELKSQGFEIAPKTLYGYETGKNQPTCESICKLADLYNVSTDYLLGRTQEAKSKRTQKKNQSAQNAPE